MSDITLGIIGSGQLGSMLCQAAKKLNVKTVVISDDEQGPAQNYCDQFIYSKYDDQNKIKDFIKSVDVVTFEFENIPVNILKIINKEKKVTSSEKKNIFIARKSILAKMNIDEAPEVAQQLKIQSIPAVMAFHDGPSIISKYLGSNIFKGSCVLGNKSAPGNGKTESFGGSSAVLLYSFKDLIIN